MEKKKPTQHRINAAAIQRQQREAERKLEAEYNKLLQEAERKAAQYERREKLKRKIQFDTDDFLYGR